MENNSSSSSNNNLPPGFRFHPTDEELITYYLSNKVSDFEFTTRAVADVDLNKCEPWDLPAKASMGEKEWYFFSLRDRKYPTGLRTNRATEAGYWKTTGKDKEIFRGNILVGMKKTLVFYRGRAPKGEKTNWVMHEYRLDNKLAFKPAKEEWVVCRVFQKSTSTIKRLQQQTPSSPVSHESPCDANTMINELGDIELPNFNTNMAINSSPISTNNIGLQNYNPNDHDHSINMMNWSSNPHHHPWPLLSTNLSMNSLLLTALHLRGRGQNINTTSDHNYNSNFGNMSQFGNDFNMMGSTSRVLDSSIPQLPPNLEQPFNLDSNIW